MDCIKKIEYFTLSDGQNLYVEQYWSGNTSNHTILLIHGGPGESCIGFSCVAPMLSEHFRVITLDQRGVLRSGNEPDNRKLTIHQILLDFEEIRAEYGIQKWWILGHSFGGYIAMRYALAFPQSLRGVFYENPCFCPENSLRLILSRYARYFYTHGQGMEAACAEQLIKCGDIIAQFDGTLSFPENVRKRLFHSEAITADCMALTDMSLITEEAKIRSVHHLQIIKRDSTLTKRFIDDLIQLPFASLLLRGEEDPMLPEEDVAVFLKNSQNRVTVIPGAGHSIHSDYPKTFVRAC